MSTFSGPDHYRKAASLVARSAGPNVSDQQATRMLAQAQVHATLALAAASTHSFLAVVDRSEWDRAVNGNS